MSKTIDLNLKSSLEELGLSDKEALVYLSLLQNNEVSAIRIARDTNLHRQFVYTALLKLTERGLVVKLGTNTRALWRAATPRKLIAIAEEVEKKAERLSGQLLELMQQKTGREFLVTEGIRAFQTRLLEVIKNTQPETTILMLCGQWNMYFARIGETNHAEWEKIRLKKGIRFRIIGPRALHIDMKDDSLSRTLTEYRVFPGLEENLVNTVIYPDHLSYEIYSEPHLTFSIKDAAIVASQKLFFEALWKKSDQL